ncbi:MAG TPA: hypothetical protein VN515_08680, partial [Terriglobales bacterium]|nr:hypothetical protein [Terriglobales bacterium]
QAAGWQVLNRTPLPLVLLGDDRQSGQPGWIEQVAQAAVASGEVWISAVRLPGGRSALRACITNYRTMPDDVRALIACLERCRSLCP